MAKLTAKQRKATPQSKYALPGKRFPLTDKIHDEKAIQLAPRSEKAGNITPMQKAMVDRKARAKLAGGK